MNGVVFRDNAVVGNTVGDTSKETLGDGAWVQCRGLMGMVWCFVAVWTHFGFCNWHTRRGRLWQEGVQSVLNLMLWDFRQSVVEDTYDL